MRSNRVKSFPVEKIIDSNNFISQLFFFGLLTIEKEKRGKLNFIIPNEIIRRMFYEYIRETYREAETFRINMQDFYNLMANMAYDGEWAPVFEYLAEELSKHTTLRDYITGEKVVHGFLLAYLSVTNFFILHSEREMNKGYADIVMEPFMAGFPDMEYSYILEIKYIKPSEYGEEIKNRKIDEAREQLERYSVDDRFKKSIERTALKKIILIFVGHELKAFREFI